MEYGKEHLTAFAQAIAPCVKGDAMHIATELIEKYKSLENVFSVDIEELTELVGAKLAAHIKLLSYNTARRGTERLIFGRRYTEEQIGEYFKSLYIGASVEQVHLMMLDSRERVIAVSQVGEGTINSSGVLPRKMVEEALAAGADSVYIAHNHPFGNCRPSAEDISFTVAMMGIFESVGVRLRGHVIVAGQRANFFDYTSLC